MPPTILIIGAGIAGPPLATLLLSTPTPPHEKPHITLLDRAGPSSSSKGQNIDIRGEGAGVLQRLGLERAVRAATTREEGAMFVDGADRVWAAFAAGKSAGTSDIEILRGRLAEILVGRCRSLSEHVKSEGGTGVEFLFGETVEHLEEDEKGVAVRFGTSGETRRFEVVVGADGLQSRTRKTVFGPQGLRALGMYGAFFSMPRGETDSLWRRWYHAPGRRAVMVRPSDRDDRSTVFMYVINDRDARLGDVAVEGGKGRVEAQKRLFSEYFRDAGWECGRVVREMMAADDFYYDAIAQVKLERWSKGRIVLLGDAAYCASPVSGMGTTLALVGAYNLAGALSRHPTDHAAAFGEYEAKTRPIVDAAQKLPPGMPHLMNPETLWGIWILRLIAAFMYWSGVGKLMFAIAGPPANKVEVEDLGLEKLQEWRG